MMVLKIDEEWITKYGEPGPEIWHDAGRFEVSTGRLVVGDPCRQLDAPESALLDQVRLGQWRVWIVQLVVPLFGRRNSELICANVETARNPPTGPLRELDIVVDVDSGLVGAFDVGQYRDDLVTDRLVHANHAYNLVPAPAGMNMPHYGVVCESGLGDWRYTGTAFADGNGQVIAFGLVFLHLDLVYKRTTPRVTEIERRLCQLKGCSPSG
jgi:hypothetical protein